MMVKNSKPIWFLFFILGSLSIQYVFALKRECLGPLMVTRDQRSTVACTDSGRISAVHVDDGYTGPYHLQFITLDPNSLLLPLLLHMDMVFYVHTGRGSVGWAGEEEEQVSNHMDVKRGDIYRLGAGTVFYVRSYSEPPLRERLRIYAFFDTTSNDNNAPEEAHFGPYSNLTDLVRGFDEKVLQMGFAVSEEAIRTIKWAAKPPPIVHYAPNQTETHQRKRDILEALLEESSSSYGFFANGKKKKTKKTFNILEKKPDVENCNGWSIAVTDKGFRGLKGSNVGVFMVNLTRGAMMGPHWNPMATEIAIVTHGQGIVQVVFPSGGDKKSAKSTGSVRFRVEEGDVFVVPKYHPMAQMSFNNESLVFVGFSTMARNNHPQFLVGKRSVMHALDRQILAVSFNITNTTVIDELLAKQQESIILECASCAEEEEKIMEEEIKRQEEEEEARKREEKERQREQEEARKREEEARRREEEEAKKREEEERREREEEKARKREEEEERREEEQERRREEEEEARRQEEEEEEERREEEKEAKKKEEQKERAESREEERRRREEEEEEEEYRRKRQEEEGQREEEEEERWERGQEEEEEEEDWRREQEEREARQQEKEEGEEWRREQDRRRKRKYPTRQEEEEEEEARKRDERESFSWRKMMLVV